MIIEYDGTSAMVQAEKSAFTYEERRVPRQLNAPIQGASNYFVGDYVVHPYGYNNDLPEMIRDVVQRNSLASGILTKKTQLVWGVGAKLYNEQISNGQVIKDWKEDNEVQDWLDSFDYEDYLLRCCIDYHHIEGLFTQIVQARSGRIGAPKIGSLKHILPNEAKLATSRGSKSKKADAAVITDFNFNDFQKAFDYKVYPLFDYKDPFKHKRSVFYSNLYSFCTDYYTIPDLYGALEWIRRSTAVPLIFKALSDNSLNVKYHVISPQAFWDNKRETLQAECGKRGKTYKESMLRTYKENMLREISNVLTGDEAVGRFWHTTKEFTVNGTNLLTHGWEIKPIDQNIKDFVESQIKISERADYAVAGGMNVHGALGNISGKGTSDSGSEQLYALKNYMLTGIDIPEMIITKAINYAIKANWPSKKLKLGFHHNVVEKESDIAPKDRVKNNV